MLDLDALFKAYLNERVAAGESMDDIEDDLPDIYRKWLDTPCEALNDVKPGQLVARTEPDALIEAFLLYHRAGLPAPEQLLDAIGDNAACEAPLYAIAGGETPASDGARINALELLHQMGSGYVLPLCLARINDAEEDDASDLAYETLASRGATILEELLAALPKASKAGVDRICGLLAEMPQNDRIFSVLLDCFSQAGNDAGYYAALLRRYGDPRALAALEEALRDGKAARYADFVAFQDAIEAFGGAVAQTPDFSGDPDYLRAQNGADEGKA